LLRNYLEAMPPELAPQLLETFRALGLDVSPFVHEGVVDVVGALDGFEAEEARLDRHRATELVERLVDNDVEPSTLRASVSAITRLAQLDPSAIEANADLVIEVLAAAAWEFDQDSPTERTKALGLLDQTPFGARAADARTAVVLVRARLEQRNGNGAEALGALVEHDPELADPKVRALWVEMMGRVFEQRLSAGNYDLATQLIDQAEALVVDDFDGQDLRRRVKWRRYRAAIVVGAIFGLVLIASVGGLVLRAAMAGLARWRTARLEMARLIRRQQDAEASSQPVGFEEEADPDLPTKLVEAPAVCEVVPEAPARDEVVELEEDRDAFGGRDAFSDGDHDQDHDQDREREAEDDRDGLADVFGDWGDGGEAVNDDRKRVS
jgi:hypothetical protein